MSPNPQSKIRNPRFLANPTPCCRSRREFLWQVGGGFTSLALATMPGLSLDHVHFQRRKIGESAIDAELRFTLFLADPV